MKNYLFILLALFCAGCVSVACETAPTASELTLKRTVFPSTDNIKVGMTRPEVDLMMGQGVVVGYQKNLVTNAVEPITMAVPYRVDKVTIDGKTADVLYYVADIKAADGQVAEDELTPVILIDGKVTAKGRDARAKLQQVEPVGK